MQDKEKILQEINRKLEKIEEYKKLELSDYNRGKLDGIVHSLLALKVFIENDCKRPAIDDIMFFHGQALY